MANMLAMLAGRAIALREGLDSDSATRLGLAAGLTDDLTQGVLLSFLIARKEARDEAEITRTIGGQTQQTQTQPGQQSGTQAPSGQQSLTQPVQTKKGP